MFYKIFSTFVLLYCAVQLSPVHSQSYYCSSFCYNHHTRNLVQFSFSHCTSTVRYRCCKSSSDDGCCFSDDNAPLPPGIPACNSVTTTLTSNTDSDYIFAQWTLVYSAMIVTLMLLAVIALCVCCRFNKVICDCCFATRPTIPQSSGRIHDVDRDAFTLDVRTTDFLSTDEFTFSPPAYETLPKDPPKYSELFSRAEGQENAGFSSDNLSQSDAVIEVRPNHSVVIDCNSADNFVSNNPHLNTPPPVYESAADLPAVV